VPKARFQISCFYQSVAIPFFACLFAQTRMSAPHGGQQNNPREKNRLFMQMGVANIHVRKGEAVAKLWLEPFPEVAESYKLSAHELRALLDVALEKKDEIERYWNEYFNC